MSNRLGGAVALALLAGAAHAGHPPQTIRICDDSGCHDRDANYARPDEKAAQRTMASDPDTYRGESRADLLAAYAQGDPIAAYKLGIVSQFGAGGTRPDEAAAVRYYSAAAAQGHAWAEYRLATLLTVGRTVPHDPARAFELQFACAKQGQPQCANNVGLVFLRGTGVPRNDAEAMHWLTIAAESGVAEAEYNLGVIYLRGDVGQDLYQGFKWTKAAADAGHPAAQKVLGRLYMTGLDTIRQNIDEATRWLEPVAAHGDREAQGWMAQIRHGQDIDRADAERMQQQSAQMFTALAGIALNAMMAPPPVYLVSRD